MKRKYQTIEVRRDGIVLLSAPMARDADDAFIPWEAVNTRMQLIALLISIAARKWASAWVLHEVALAAVRHFRWEWPKAASERDEHQTTPRVKGTL